MNAEKLIAELGLLKHQEGGFYRRTYQANNTITQQAGESTRMAMSSIYYLLTKDSPIGHWHRNRSDILHYYHLGSPLTYWVIDHQGCVTRYTLGHRVDLGHQLQLLVRAGCWKATELESGEFGLLSEAVTPGFEYEDMELAKTEQIVPLLKQADCAELEKFVAQ